MGTVPKPDPWKCHSRLRHKIVTLEVLRSLLENAVVKVTWLLPLSTVTAPGITNIFFFFMSQVQTPKNRIWLDQLLVTAQWNEPGWERFTCHSALKSTDCLQVRCQIRCRRGRETTDQSYVQSLPRTSATSHLILRESSSLSHVTD